MKQSNAQNFENPIIWRKDPMIEQSFSKLETFSADDVINAFLNGVKKKESNDLALKRQAFENNLKKAKEVSFKLWKLIKDSGFECSQIKLKAESIFNFQALILVPEETFCSDEFLDIKYKIIDIEEKVNKNSLFNYTYSFVPFSEFTREEIMLADGYIFTLTDE